MPRQLLHSELDQIIAYSALSIVYTHVAASKTLVHTEKNAKKLHEPSVARNASIKEDYTKLKTINNAVVD